MPRTSKAVGRTLGEPELDDLQGLYFNFVSATATDVTLDWNATFRMKDVDGADTTIGPATTYNVSGQITRPKGAFNFIRTAAQAYIDALVAASDFQSR